MFLEALFVREGILSWIEILNSYLLPCYYCGMPFFLGDVYFFIFFPPPFEEPVGI